MDTRTNSAATILASKHTGTGGSARDGDGTTCGGHNGHTSDSDGDRRGSADDAGPSRCRGQCRRNRQCPNSMDNQPTAYSEPARANDRYLVSGRNRACGDDRNLSVVRSDDRYLQPRGDDRYSPGTS